MPRWTVPRWFWRLNASIGQPSKKPKQLGAIGSQESKIAYSKALGKAAAVRSSQSAVLHREHIRLMQELEEQAKREESKSHHDFLSACQAIPVSCSATPQGESDYLLPCLVRVITSVTSICSTCQGTPGRRTATHGHLSQASAQMVPMAKKAASFARAEGSMSIDEISPRAHAGRTIQLQEMRDSHLVCLTQTQSCGGLQLRLQHRKRSQVKFLFQPLL